jgi:hypothetical protein
VKRLFTTVRIDENSGILVQKIAAPAGYIRRIRIWNLVEPGVVYGLIMLVVWTSMLDPKVWWMRPSFGVLLVWMLIVSPLLHYPFEKDLFLTPAQKRLGVWFYFFECRGLGSPLRYYLPVDGQPPFIRKYWKTVLGVTLFLDVLFLCAMVTFNGDIHERFKEHMGTTMAQGLFFRVYMLLLIDVGLVLVAYPFMLRLDNFRESLKFMGAFGVLIAVIALTGNFLFHLDETGLREALKDHPYFSLRGPTTGERLRALTVAGVGGQWSGYVFWGFLQQLLFLGIFSVQICRGFDVGRSRVQLFLACLCSATLFALIHIPNFWLSLVTFVGGFLGALFSIQCRNLFALGIIHGFGGTMMNKLLPINFSVGPSQIR